MGYGSFVDVQQPAPPAVLIAVPIADAPRSTPEQQLVLVVFECIRLLSVLALLVCAVSSLMLQAQLHRDQWFQYLIVWNFALSVIEMHALIETEDVDALDSALRMVRACAAVAMFLGLARSMEWDWNPQVYEWLVVMCASVQLYECVVRCHALHGRARGA